MLLGVKDVLTYVTKGREKINGVGFLALVVDVPRSRATKMYITL